MPARNMGARLQLRRCVRCYLAVLLLPCHVFNNHPFAVGAFITPASTSRYNQNTVAKPSPASNINTLCDSPTDRVHKTKRKSATLQKASPSGIDEWPQLYQAAVFFGTYAALGIATHPTTKLLEILSRSSLIGGLERWRTNVIDSTLPLLLGSVYFAAGIGHFACAPAFRDIFPPPGTWGIWHPPGTPGFHVAWTGAAEILGGSGLLFGGLRDSALFDGADGGPAGVSFVKPAAASALFLLTVLVTPANIYMFTHGAVMGDTASLGVTFHAVRFAVQVVLLSLLLTLARDSFFFAWGDELD